jgi:peptide/nickel transport system permease protein
VSGGAPTTTATPLPAEAARRGFGPRRLDGSRRRPLLWFVVRRLAAGAVLLFVVSVLVFAATNVLPGDAASAVLGRQATPASLAALREELGLDRPLARQYLDWIGGVLKGDLGESLTARRPVWDTIRNRVTHSLALALYTMAILVPLSVVLGVLAGRRAGRPADQVISGVTLGVIAVPEFVIGSLLVLLFAVTWTLLPAVSLLPPGASAFAQLDVLVLPVATLTLAGLAYMVRIIRAGVIEVMASDYVEMARLNGAPERRILWKHVLRNALAPSVQAFALTLQWLVGGVLIVETLFGFPGLGKALVDAIFQRDLPTVQSVGVLIAALYIVINILADLAVVLVVPRLRTAQQ